MVTYEVHTEPPQMIGATVQNILYLGNLAPSICALLLNNVMEVERSANNEERSGRDLFQ
jgi:hypothetical protein